MAGLGLEKADRNGAYDDAQDTGVMGAEIEAPRGAVNRGIDGEVAALSQNGLI
jgi:hypothetical protein